MEIRPDFEAIKAPLSRLLVYAQAFGEFNLKDWSHYRKREDYQRIYDLPDDNKKQFERIYGDGRDIAIYMSSKLEDFNDAKLFPTLKSFIESFDGTWIDEIEDLRKSSMNAKNISKMTDNCPYAVEKMIALFDKQIELLDSVKHTLNSLKDTNIYKWENGDISLP